MKKLLSVLLALTLLISLVACGDSKDKKKDRDDDDDDKEKTSSVAVSSDDIENTSVSDMGDVSCEHTFKDEWETVQVSDCKNKGYQERTCENCSYTERQELPLGDHSYAGGVCTVCGDSLPASTGLQFVSEYDVNPFKYEWVYYLTGMGTCTDTAVTVPGKHGEGEDEHPVIGIGMFAELNQNITEITFLSPIYDMPDYFFGKYGSLEKVVFAEGQTKIWTGSFNNSASIKTVVLPSTIDTIDNYAFSGCTALQAIRIPSGVQILNEKTFSGCTALTSVELQEGLVKINERAFENCTSLQNIKLPSTVETIGGYAFYNSGLTEIEFPEQLTSIGAFALAGNKSLKTIKMGDNVTIVGICAFQNCFDLESVKLSANLTSIGKGGFSGCMKLTSITLPVSLTSIGADAFNYASKLTEIIYEGTMEQWSQIQLGAGWNNGCAATVVKCSDGEVTL